MKFNIGDTVQLKSGGPIMTVQSVQNDGSLWCVWFNTKDGAHEIKGFAFKAEILTQA